MVVRWYIYGFGSIFFMRQEEMEQAIEHIESKFPDWITLTEENKEK